MFPHMTMERITPDSFRTEPSPFGDSTVNYIDRDLVEVLTMSNSLGTCNCFFTTRGYPYLQYEWTFEKDPTDPRWYRGYVDGKDMGVFSIRQWIGKMERRYNKAL